MLGCNFICVRLRNCSYNKIARSIGLLDKIAILFVHVNFHTSKSFCDRRPLKQYQSITKIERSSIGEHYHTMEYLRTHARVTVEKTCNDHMSRVMRKSTFCICENKDADQLRGNREADQRLCFRYTDRTIPLLSSSEISRL